MKRLLLILLFSFPLFGLKTQYVSFDHPEGWVCELSQGVFICQSKTEPERKESIVLSIATIASEWDSLENYEEYLKRPKTIQDDAGKELTSKVTYSRKRNINGTVWIDSLQYNSELPGFWARYLATVQNKLAILITYIVSDDMYSKLAPTFEKMVASLKPNAEFDLTAVPKQPMPGSEIIGKAGPQTDLFKERLNKKPGTDAKTVPEGGQGNSLITLLSILVVIILGAIVILRRAKK